MDEILERVRAHRPALERWLCFDADLLQRLEDLEAFTEAFDQALRAGEDPTPAFHHLDGTSLALRILWDRRVEALAQIL